VVAFFITFVVYGVVALIVKMDDFGLHLAERRSALVQKIGRGMVTGMPKLLTVISTVGVVAMLWVGGHILLVGADELGWHAPYGLVHDLEHDISHALPHALHSLTGTVAWTVNTAASALVGLLVGAVVVAIMHLVAKLRGGHTGHTAEHTAQH